MHNSLQNKCWNNKYLVCHMTAFIMTLTCSEPILVINWFTHVFTLCVKQCDWFLGSWKLWWLERDKSATYFHFLCHWAFLNFWCTVIKYNIPGTSMRIWCNHFISLQVWNLSILPIFFISIFYTGRN